MKAKLAIWGLQGDFVRRLLLVNRMLPTKSGRSGKGSFTLYNLTFLELYG